VRKLVQHQQQSVSPVFCVKIFGQPPADLVEHEAHERLGPTDVRGRHHEIQCCWLSARDDVSDAPIAPGRDGGNDRIAVEANDMAVESTPERSLSDLLSSSRAALAMTGCDPFSPRCGVVIMADSVDSIGRRGSDKRRRDAGLVLSGA
jgi:hypothetical protein